MVKRYNTLCCFALGEYIYIYIYYFFFTSEVEEILMGLRALQMTWTQQQGKPDSVLVQWEISCVCSLLFSSCFKMVLPGIWRVANPIMFMWRYGHGCPLIYMKRTNITLKDKLSKDLSHPRAPDKSRWVYTCLHSGLCLNSRDLSRSRTWHLPWVKPRLDQECPLLLWQQDSSTLSEVLCAPWVLICEVRKVNI